MRPFVVPGRPLFLALAALVGFAAPARAEAQVLAKTMVAPPVKVVGRYEQYKPLASFLLGNKVTLEVPLELRGRLEDVSSFAVDRDGTRYASGVVLAPLMRLGLRLDTLTALEKVNLLIEAEADLPTGFYATETPIAGAGLPNSGSIEVQPRLAYARLAFGRHLHVGGGLFTQHFGLGLVSNDGAHGWEPGSARFIDPRAGDRVAGGYVGTGPLTRTRFVARLSAQSVYADDIKLQGDTAMQVTGAALVGYGLPSNLGVFVVHRRQKSIEGYETNVTAIDLAGQLALKLPRDVAFTLAGELVVVAGTSELGPTADHPRQDLLQVGAAARATVSSRIVSGVVDFLFASGDQHPDDGRATGFSPDPNYEMGLFLYRYVRAAQTGRAVATASNPELVGQPAPGLERVPTRGSASNTIALFPRLSVRPLKGLDVYGGPLFAFAAAGNADPFNSRIAGGAVRNALDGAPGSYYGTELDLGVRYRALLKGTELTAGVEGGVLLPGSALNRADGQAMGQVGGARVILQYRL